MDRDRRPVDSVRRRELPPDVPPEDRFRGGSGQSYRPGAARRSSPPRGFSDSYRARSPRARTPPPARYRSRSPPRRSPARYASDSYPPRRDDYRQGIPRGGDSYRAADRPRREDLPRNDLLRRDPVREERDYREPYRDDRAKGYGSLNARSPMPRPRDRSMSSRGRRTPPRGSRYDPPSRGVSPPRRRFSPEPRERRPSPPRGVTRDYRLRSRSPLARNVDRVDPRAVDDWRRRSPVREPRQDYLREESGANSANTSRRSSPPVHPSRMAFQPPADERPRSRRASPRDPYDDREPYRAGDEAKPRNVPQPQPPAYDDDRNYSNARDIPPSREPKRDDSELPTPRAPPTGPSSQRSAPVSMAPPTGPAAAPNAPAGPRAASNAPPAGPRGSFAPRGDFAGRGRGGFSNDFSPRGRGSGFGGVAIRGGRGGGGAPPTGPGFNRASDPSFTRSPEAPQDPTFGSRPPPSGPRNSFSQAPPPTFRQNSGSTVAPSGPRALRDTPMPDAPTGPKALSRRPTEPTAPRQHPALADLPKVIEGGQRAEPIIDRTKLNRLEDEAEKLRRQIEERETRKRKSLREWDRMTRESEIAALRGELAEQALKELNGEAESQAAF